MVKTKKFSKHFGGFANAVSSAANTTVNKAKSNPIATIVILLLVVLFIVLIVWLVNTLRGKHTKSTDKNPIWIPNPVSANVIKHHKKFRKGFKVPENPNALNFSYSIWVYIADWNYNFNKFKNIFVRQRRSGGRKAMKNNMAPGLYLYPKTNNLFARISTFADPSEGCDIKNIPIQKWVNIIYVLNNRTVDIYIDGKLERSCVLMGIPNVDKNARVYVGEDGGFYGQISKFQYYSHSLAPNEVVEIYEDGPFEAKKYNVNFFNHGKFMEITDPNSADDGDENPDADDSNN